MDIVNYNFPSLLTVNNPAAMINDSSDLYGSANPTVNFYYSSTNYTANKVFFCTDSGNNYFVVQSETDTNINNPGYFYVAVQLIVDSTNNQTQLTSLSTAASSSATLSNLDLKAVFSDIIKSGSGSGYVLSNGTDNCFVSDTSLNIQSFPTNTQLNPTNFGFSTAASNTAASTATLSESYIGWDLSCVLLDDYGEAYPNPTANTPTVSTDSANTLVLLSLVVMVIGAIYVISPVIYPRLFEGAKKTRDGMSHLAFNWYWFIILILGSVPSIILSAASNKPSFMLLFLTYVMTYFSGTAGVVAYLGRENPDAIKNGSFVSDEHLITNLGALFLNGSYTNSNTLYKKISLVSLFGFLFLLAGYILTFVGACLGASNPATTPLYATGSILYFLVAIVKFLVLAPM